MRILFIQLEKEFRQIFRDTIILTVLFGMPAIELLILPFAANYEVRNIYLVVVDHDHSSDSRRLIEQIKNSAYFELAGYKHSYKEALIMMESDEADLILEIPNGFERNLVRESSSKVFVAVNAINGVKANIGEAYLQKILMDYNDHLRVQLTAGALPPISQIEVSISNWFNPLLDYNKFMVPGILAILATIISVFFSATNIVKEKEIGTIEQINVTPIKKLNFILGKLIPFWILSVIIFTVGLLIAWLVYAIIPVGSLFLLYGFLSIYLVAILGFGLLVSDFCSNQQQANLVIFFFIMIWALMGGLFTSIDSMPYWAKVVTFFNPIRYLIEVFRLIILKGSNFHDLLPHFGIMTLFAVFFNGLAVKYYRKRN